MLLLRDNPQAASTSITGAFSEVEGPEEFEDDEEVGEGEDPTHPACDGSAPSFGAGFMQPGPSLDLLPPEKPAHTRVAR